MPTKRERLERRVKVAIAAGGTLWMLHVFHDANVYAFALVGPMLLGMFRWMANDADPELIGYERHEVDGEDRWFCEVCGKEEGECARCYEVEV